MMAWFKFGRFGVTSVVAARFQRAGKPGTLETCRHKSCYAALNHAEMMRYHRLRSGVVTRAFGLAWRVGGRQGEIRRPALPASAPAGERTPKLTAEQVADVQIALGRSQEEGGGAGQAMASYQEAIK